MKLNKLLRKLVHPVSVKEISRGEDGSIVLEFKPKWWLKYYCYLVVLSKIRIKLTIAE